MKNLINSMGAMENGRKPTKTQDISNSFDKEVVE
jgi:hypothetical protein